MTEIGPKKLRAHQQEAVDAVTQALARMSRATMISATGTGKTLTAMRIAEHFADQSNILVVVPSLSLIDQTARQWHIDSSIRHMAGVCSLRSHQVTIHRGQIELTTAPRHLAQTVAAHTGPTVVFATYSSLPVLTKAHRSHRLPAWGLIVIDEAHRSSGSSTRKWASIHRDADIPAQRRLYMTATPRLWKHPDSKEQRRETPRPEQPSEPLASMDDATIYGPVVYNLGLADAIDRGILADYRIVAPVITDDDLHQELQNKDNITSDPDALRLSALQVCLLHAMATHQVRRVISFHSRIAYASHFSETLPHTVTAARHSTRIRRLWVHALHSKHPQRQRARSLAEFDSIPLLRRRSGPADTVDGAVLCNVRVLGEGVDVPDADAVLFADPKRSSSDIIQALGRALRQPPGAGKVAILIIPVYIGRRQKTADAMKSSDFSILWDVLTGLRAHDAKIWRRMATGPHLNQRKVPRPSDPERPGEVATVTRLREHQIDNGLWEAGWNAAVRYFEDRGHLNVPSGYTDHTGYPLGLWIGQQRSLYAHGSLDPDRALALASLNISWQHPPGSFEARLEEAVTCASTYGTLALATAPEHTDEPLIRWLNRQRGLADSGRLHTDRIDALNAVDPWWNPHWGVAWQHDYTHLILTKNPDPSAPTPASGDDAATWLDQQITQLLTLHPQQQRLLAQLATLRPTLHPHSMLLLTDASPRARAFNRSLTAARQFQQREGHLDVPLCHRETVRGDEVLLGRWIKKTRTNAAQMTKPQIIALTELGVRLDPVFRPAPESLAATDEANSEDGLSWPPHDLSWTRPIRSVFS